MIVTDQRVAKFVADRLGFTLCPPYTSMGIEREGKIVAGVLFNCFEGADVHVTVAGKCWTRGFIEAVGGYVFDTLECQRMTMLTESSEVVGLALRCGGQVEGKLRDHFGFGRPATLVGILRADWKWPIGTPNRRG